MTYMADLQLKENTQPWEVKARDSGEIAKALRDHGVISAIESGYRSGYVWQLSWALTPAKDAAGCHVGDVKVTLTSITSLPKWTPPPKTPPALVNQWSAFSSTLAAHLAKQRNVAVAKAQQLRPRIAKLQAQSCESLQRGVDYIGGQWIEDMHKADDDFNRATRHGEANGVVWPPKIQAPGAAPAPK